MKGKIHYHLINSVLYIAQKKAEKVTSYNNPSFMNSIRIKNFRSIVDSGDVPINRVNILLGKNSSGKSSFIRLFPMMKQTIHQKGRGPVIWFDEHYDLGKFDTALSRHASEDKQIMFGVMMDKPKKVPNCKTEKCVDCTLINPEPNVFLNNSSIVGAYMYLSNNHKGETIVSRVELKSDHYSIELKLNDEHDCVVVTINGSTYFDNNSMIWGFQTTRLLPNLLVSVNSKLGKTQNKLNKIFKGLSVMKKRHLDDFYNIKTINPDDILVQWKKKQENNPLLSAVVKQIESNLIEANDVISFVIYTNLTEFLGFLDKRIFSYFDQSYYIAPVRYNYGRFMRNKEQSVECIDPIGKNVMEYIENMSKDDLKSYKKFLMESFNATFSVKGKDNKSIMVTKDGETDNLVDVGSGFAQILPIATMLWDIVNRRGLYCGMPFIVAIEQPELHLHPSMQAEFAEMIIRVMNDSIKKSNNLHLVIETHSPIIINRIGRSLRKKIDDQKVSSEDISIYLFEKDNGVSKITRTKYNEDGRIENWPIGFLD